MRAWLYLAAVIAGLGGTQALESIAEREEARAAPGCLVFVIDTSATLRDPRSGRLAPVIFQTVLGTLARHPEVARIQMFDAEGGPMLGGRDEWVDCSVEALWEIERVLGRDAVRTVANPAPGIDRALHALALSVGDGARVQVYVVGEGLGARGESVFALRAGRTPMDSL